MPIPSIDRAVALVVVVAAALSATAFHPTAAAAAAPITVNSERDARDAAPGDGVCETQPGGGDCTLRAAVMEANVLAGPDTILLPAGSYELTLPPAGEPSLMLAPSADLQADRGDLDITGDLTLVGDGADRTLIGRGRLAAAHRILHLGPGVALHIEGVTIRGRMSPYGAGIYAAPTAHLTLLRTHVTGNRASWFGGGVAAGYNGAGATLIVESNALTDNAAAAGGTVGLSGAGTATLVNATISGNAGGPALLARSTAEAELWHVTVAANSRTAIAAQLLAEDGARIALRSSIVASLDPAVAANCAGDIVSRGHNLSDDASCGLDGDRDLEDRPARLRPLNGAGSSTPYHALFSDSPAVDRISVELLPRRDQRGMPRPQPVAGYGDIGAYELERPGAAAGSGPAPGAGAVPVLVSALTPGDLTCADLLGGALDGSGDYATLLGYAGVGPHFGTAPPDGFGVVVPAADQAPGAVVSVEGQTAVVANLGCGNGQSGNATDLATSELLAAAAQGGSGPNALDLEGYSVAAAVAGSGDAVAAGNVSSTAIGQVSVAEVAVGGIPGPGGAYPFASLEALLGPAGADLAWAGAVVVVIQQYAGVVNVGYASALTGDSTAISGASTQLGAAQLASGAGAGGGNAANVTVGSAADATALGGSADALGNWASTRILQTAIADVTLSDVRSAFIVIRQYAGVADVGLASAEAADATALAGSVTSVDIDQAVAPGGGAGGANEASTASVSTATATAVGGDAHATGTTSLTEIVQLAFAFVTLNNVGETTLLTALDAYASIYGYGEAATGDADALAANDSSLAIAQSGGGEGSDGGNVANLEAGAEAAALAVDGSAEAIGNLSETEIEQITYAQVEIWDVETAVVLIEQYAEVANVGVADAETGDTLAIAEAESTAEVDQLVTGP